MEKEYVDIGALLRNERKTLGFSLEEAANRTGVSKTMLGQIERGVSSPTLSTVWKIATGLRIPLSKLLQPCCPNEYQVRSLSQITPVIELDGGIRVYTLFPFNPVASIDYLYVIEQPGCRYESTTHPNAQEEYLIVNQGVLTMHIGDRTYTLGRGDSMSFSGAEKHAYENLGGEAVVFQSIVRY